MKAETLKKSILQYALEGKLVPQDPNDEPASVLLKRIKAEKESLIKSDKIRTEKPLRPIEENEVPFDIPRNWTWTRLGELSSINGGYAFKSCEYTSSGIRIVRISDFDESGFKNDKLVYQEEDVRYDNFTIENQDILMAMTGGTVGKCYYVENLQEKMYVNQRVADIKINKNINSKFINYFIRSPFIQDVITSCKNSTNDNISMRDIKEFYVPLPPLAEQQRIVEKLEQILLLIEKYQENEEALSALKTTLPNKIKQSILQYAFQGRLVSQNPNDEPASVLLKRIKAEKESLIKSDKIRTEKPLRPIEENEVPFDIPRNWTWTRLGELSSINGGYAFKSCEYTSSGIRIVRISDFDESGFKNDKLVYQEEDVRYDNFTIENQDILMAMTGGTVGKCYYVENLQEKMYVNQRVADIKINKNINSKFINYLIRSPFIQDVITSCKNSTNDNISMRDIKEFYVPLPPLAEQQRIVDKIEELLLLVEMLK